MRIAFCGAQGTGKTTLATSKFFRLYFADHPCIDGIVRKLPKSYSDRRRQFHTSLTYLRYHFRLKNFVSSRSIFDVWAYNRLSVKTDFLFQTFNLAQKYLNYDYLFYIPIEFDLIDDGFRPTDKEYQIAIDKEIKLLLDFYHIPYNIITGTIEQRIEKIENICLK